jgi:epoxyqueuosine reductase
VSIEKQIKSEAHRLGFQLVGITTPDPPPHLGIYQDWLAAGRHGEMSYLSTERSRERRSDPRLILPECKSILALGIRYPSPKKDEKVASYAHGDDYHELLTGRLKALVAYIEAGAGQPVSNRWYTDTGPILERDLAQRAGLGWAGKNTCLIHPQLGSYFLLAEILLGLELEPDPPFLPDLCGSCTRCLDACPTNCILPDRTIDSGRCISYLTIELKGPIPAELRLQMGEWIFGCDICQQVCPWNLRFADPGGPEERQASDFFRPRPGVPHPDLIEELRLTPIAFQAKFKSSPVKRAKRSGYLRNVAVALGNAMAEAGGANPAAVAALARSLQADPEPLVRSHAAWALGCAGGEEAYQALAFAKETEKDAEVRNEIWNALETFR